MAEGRKNGDRQGGIATSSRAQGDVVMSVVKGGKRDKDFLARVSG